MSQCKEYLEINFDLICLEKTGKDLVVTSLSMLLYLLYTLQKKHIHTSTQVNTSLMLRYNGHISCHARMIY